jgi:hypothetical protein
MIITKGKKRRYHTRYEKPLPWARGLTKQAEEEGNLSL